MLAEGIGAFTSQFKKGGMTNKNTKKKLSKKDIEFIEAYANGGEVSNSELIQKDVYEVGDKVKYIDSFRKDEREGTIGKISETGNYIVYFGSGFTAGQTSVEKKDIVGAYPKIEPKKKRFGLFEDGGKTIDEVWDKHRIADQYEGRKPEDIWNRLSPSQRRHLLLDHANFPDTGELRQYVDWSTNFDDLEPFIQKILKKHFAEGQYAKGGKTKTKFSKGDKVIGQFRHEYGEGLQPVSLMDYADRVRGVVSNVKKIDTTTMYVIDFENGEQLQYPDFAIDNFIKKVAYAKGGSTDPKPSAQDILKRLGYNLPALVEEVEEEKIIRGWVDDEPYYFAKGGMSKDDSPKVYIADLMEYNNGRLVGKWFDLTNYSDASELMQDIQAMLDEQTKKDPDGEVHEEWAVHDYENFPRAMYSEYMNEADFQKIIDVIQGAEDSNLPFDVILEAMSDLGLEDITDVKDRYFSSVPASMGNEWRDFAYEYVDAIGGISSGIKNPDYYFDFEAFGRDERINMGGEQEEEMGYEDLTDEQLGEQLVDEIGGVGELSESTIDMYFDYDKFGRELQYDFTAVRGEDGNYYFFTTNYKKGGKLKSKPDPKDEGEYELTEEDKKIIRGYVDDEPYYFAEGGEVTMDEKKRSLKGQPKLKF
jgi:antirestriction protein